MPTTTTTYCAKHPKVETSVTCASCGTPICPKCMVYTPVGTKCPDCGLSKGTGLFKVSPFRLALAGIAALIAGATATALGGMGFFYVIIIAVPYGYFAGGLILKASGMKRGMKLEIAAGAGMVVGALAFKLLPGLVAGKPLIVLGNTMLSVGPTSLLDPIFLVTVAIATGCAVSKIRYL